MSRPICIHTGLLCLWLTVSSTLFGQHVEHVDIRQAVEAALRNSPEVAFAQAEYNVAKATVDVNKAEFRPNLYTGSGAAYTYGFPQTLEGAAPSIVNLSYIQSLFNPLLSAQTR